MAKNIYYRFNVDCTETEDFYSINEKIGSTEPISNEDSISSEPAPSQTNQRRRRPQNQQPQAQRRAEGQSPQGQRSQGELLFFRGNRKRAMQW